MKKNSTEFKAIFYLLSSLIILSNLAYIFFYMLKIYPLSPWDAGIIVEAFRIDNNQPVYENYITGHATHMYGWFYNYTLWFFFNLVGFNNYIPRIISLLASITLISILTTIICRGQNVYKYILVFALFFGININIGNYFVYGRPDAVAAFFGVISIILIFISYYKVDYILFILSLIFLILAYSTKQTYAFVATIPLISLLLLRDITLKSLINSLLPLITVFIFIVFLYLYKPFYFYYMMTVPGMYKIQFSNIIENLYSVLLNTPVFIYLFLFWVYKVPKNYKMELVVWSLGSIIISLLISSFSIAKIGGAVNSNLPAYLSIYFFCGLILLYKFKYLESIKLNWITYVIWSMMISLLILLSLYSIVVSLYIQKEILYLVNVLSVILITTYTFKIQNVNKIILNNHKRFKFISISFCLILLLLITISVIYSKDIFINSYASYINKVKKRNQDYSKITKIVKGLEGRVISPEDPTIVLYSKNTADRIVFFEYESRPEDGDIPINTPQHLIKYYLEADYIVDTENWWYNRLTHDDLKKLNYKKISDSNNLTLYSVWKKIKD